MTNVAPKEEISCPPLGDGSSVRELWLESKWKTFCEEEELSVGFIHGIAGLRFVVPQKMSCNCGIISIFVNRVSL